MDDLDLKILNSISADARINWSDLAKQLHVSNPTIADRVRRMEERGVIRGYYARIDPEAVGAGLAALIFVTLEHPRSRPAFLKRVEALPQIQECHHITGDDDFLLKVRCGSTKELEELISVKIKGVAGVLRTRSVIVLSTVKETTVLPMREG